MATSLSRTRGWARTFSGYHPVDPTDIDDDLAVPPDFSGLGWFNVAVNGQRAWSTGRIIDVGESGVPLGEKINSERENVEAGHLFEGKRSAPLSVIARHIRRPEDEMSETIPANLVYLCDPAEPDDAKAAITTIPQEQYQYFVSKYPDATFYVLAPVTKAPSRILIESAGNPVGVIAQYQPKLGTRATLNGLLNLSAEARRKAHEQAEAHRLPVFDADYPWAIQGDAPFPTKKAAMAHLNGLPEESGHHLIQQFNKKAWLVRPQGSGSLSDKENTYTVTGMPSGAVQLHYNSEVFPTGSHRDFATLLDAQLWLHNDGIAKEVQDVKQARETAIQAAEAEREKERTLLGGLTISEAMSKDFAAAPKEGKPFLRRSVVAVEAALQAAIRHDGLDCWTYSDQRLEGWPTLQNGVDARLQAQDKSMLDRLQLVAAKSEKDGAWAVRSSLLNESTPITDGHGSTPAAQLAAAALLRDVTMKHYLKIGLPWPVGVMQQNQLAEVFYTQTVIAKAAGFSVVKAGQGYSALLPGQQEWQDTGRLNHLGPFPSRLNALTAIDQELRRSGEKTPEQWEATALSEKLALARAYERSAAVSEDRYLSIKEAAYPIDGTGWGYLNSQKTDGRNQLLMVSLTENKVIRFPFDPADINEIGDQIIALANRYPNSVPSEAVADVPYADCPAIVAEPGMIPFQKGDDAADWIVMNAPRPLVGDRVESGDFLNGRFFAFIKPNTSTTDLFVQQNMKDGAVIVVTATQDQQMGMAIHGTRYEAAYQEMSHRQRVLATKNLVRKLNTDYLHGDLVVLKGKVLASQPSEDMGNECPSLPPAVLTKPKPPIRQRGFGEL